MRVGRDHIASVVNTLFLAYAGASLGLLVLFSTSGLPVLELVNTELVAVELVKTMVGSLGLLAAVPLTTVIAAASVVGTDRRRGHGRSATGTERRSPEPRAWPGAVRRSGTARASAREVGAGAPHPTVCCAPCEAARRARTVSRRGWDERRERRDPDHGPRRAVRAGQRARLRAPLGAPRAARPARASRDGWVEDNAQVARDQGIEVIDDLVEDVDRPEAAPLSASSDSVRQYLNEIGRTELLTAEQEVDLAKRYQAGLEAAVLLAQHPDMPRTRARRTPAHRPAG
jgi:hypothetical protein